MTAAPQSCQPNKDEALLATCDPVVLAKLVLALRDQVGRLQLVLRDLLECGAFIEMEGCNCETCAPVARARAALEAKSAGETGNVGYWAGTGRAGNGGDI